MNQFTDLINRFTQKEVTSNPNVDNELAGNVAKEAGNSIADGLRSAISNGDITSLLNVASNSTEVNSLTSNPVVKNIIDNLTSKLSTNVGLDQNTSSGIAGSVIPQILSSVLGDAKSGNFNLTELLSSLGGGNGNLLDQNGDGKVDFKDAVEAFQNGKLKDLLGGFFGK